MKIKINGLIIAHIYIVLFIEFFISVLFFPKALRYILDLNLLVIMLIYFVLQKKRVESKEYIIVKKYLIIYMSLMLLGGVFASVPIGQILWAARNNFFYVLFMFFTVSYLKENEITKVIDNLCKIQILNVICGTIEFFLLHKKNDYLGGIFGIEQGCNAYLNIYCVIICAYVFSKYMYKKSSLLNVILVFGSSIYMAILSELKIMFIELVIIVILAILMSGNISKIVGIFITGILGIYYGGIVISIVNPEILRIISSLENMVDYGTRVDYGNGDIRIARMSAISQVNEYFFKGDLKKELFGYGFGACEESVSFPFCNSSFADKYSYLGYRNLTTSMNYLETGALGLVMFLVSFVMMIIIAQKAKKILGEKIYIATYVQIVVFVSILNFAYNSSIRRMIAYVTFFVIAHMFVVLREKKLEIEGEVGYDIR